ncbi:hypothetical protein HMN09_00103100 [Mycena chlorophos]|uniref:Uncharacterized protein n=1 Tax=Mycena chlorophos TaxID=658473 RepID=A0A8H6TUE3_MYCCL|nr:hypothetical protein HMN09_00103100 [Mycena chlorophos]
MSDSEPRTRVRCTCQRFCRGSKSVSLATWYNHADYRPGGQKAHYTYRPRTLFDEIDDDDESSSSESSSSDSESSSSSSSRSSLSSSGSSSSYSRKSPPHKKRRMEQESDGGMEQGGPMQMDIDPAQQNALYAILPQLAKSTPLPRGARDLGDGFVLLRRRDELPHLILGERARAMREYLVPDGDPEAEVCVKRWARLRLPNGQIARSAWKEKMKSPRNVRMARNVKFVQNNRAEIAEVEFYFRTRDGRTLALAGLYPRPDRELWELSFQTAWSCEKPDRFIVFPVQDIRAVVAMIPHKRNGQDYFFLVEKPGLDIISLTGDIEEDDEDA